MSFTKTNKQVIIVNRHYPPNPGITGESAWDLAKYLIEKHDTEVHIVHIIGNDDGGGQVRQPVGVIHSLSSIYTGNNKILKQLSGFLDGYFLLKKAKNISDTAPIICMTSPPLLPFWASLLLKRRQWALWSMDLFPEAFVAIGMIAEKSFLYRYFLRKTYQNRPTKLIALGQKQAEFIQGKYKIFTPPNPPQQGTVRRAGLLTPLPTEEGSGATNASVELLTPLPFGEGSGVGLSTILPCGVIFHQTYETELPSWRKKNDGKIYFGYCGNLNDAHNENFLIEFIKAFDPQKHHLILALYGKKAEKMLEFARNQAEITILANVPRSQLNFIDVHLVSLISKYTHLMIPSKAVSAVASGGAMLFCGNPESDNWDMLQTAAWLINEEGNLGKQMSKFLSDLTQETLLEKKQNARKLNINLQKMVIDGYEEIAEFIA